MERDVPDDDRAVEQVIREGRGKMPPIGKDWGDRRQPRAKTLDASTVQVDRKQVAPEVGERARESAVATADLEDGAVRRTDEGDDAFDGRTVVEEVLAELVPAAVRGA